MKLDRTLYRFSTRLCREAKPRVLRVVVYSSVKKNFLFQVTAIQFKAHCKTDSGRCRTNNEDCCLVDTENKFCLVADGVGGAAAGELASSLFAQTVSETFADHSLEACDLQSIIKKCFKRSHARIRKYITEKPECKGMGCTAELITFSEGRAIIGHVGDSRTYRYRQGKLELLTADHSFVYEQLKVGLITEKQAKTHKMRNLILRAVGIEDDLEADVILASAQVGDLFLLCTDGLTDMVDEKTIEKVLTVDKDVSSQTRQLIELANEAGGKDNISVVCCLVTST